MFTSLISVMAAMLAVEPAELQACRPSPPEHCDVTSDIDVPVPVADSIDLTIDPRAFFDQLVRRYRDISVYRDVTRIIQITHYRGEDEPQRVETEVESSIENNAVSISTPGLQLARTLGLAIPLRVSREMDCARKSYELWLLPHLTLKLTEEPLKEFREGVSEGFTATEAASVTLDDRPMVHLELKSGAGLSEDSEARFDLFVDPESMLIERIQGEQRLPNGGHYETTLEIEPRHVEAHTAEPYSTSDACEKAADDEEPIYYPGFGGTSSECDEAQTTPSAWPDLPPTDQPLSRSSSTKGSEEPHVDEGHADAPHADEECSPRPPLPRKGESHCENADDDEQRKPCKPRRSSSD